MVKDTGGDFAWGKDTKSLYYTKLDDAHRPYQVYRHLLSGSADEDKKEAEGSDEDELLFTEDDPVFRAYVSLGGFLLFHLCLGFTSSFFGTDFQEPQRSLSFHRE